jgi:glycosyltransferase involved in cell wall biosynthesis
MMSNNLFGITSAFGSPSDRKTWSAAPANVAAALERRGMTIVPFNTSLGRLSYAIHAIKFLAGSYGRLSTSEGIARAPAIRRQRAHRLARSMKRKGVTRVLHTGTLGMPNDMTEPEVRHYLFCDHTWNLSLLHRTDLSTYSRRAIRDFDTLERESYHRCEHIFTFGEYVREDLIRHYGMPADRVTAVGSGMGDIKPYDGPKDYSTGRLLFIAKHLFYEKGGPLLLEAFKIAVRERPDLHLNIVGSIKGQKIATDCPNVESDAFVPWEVLQDLQRRACVLAQPMLNDPWGQVYLEALLSRTPVIGLNRNGLPEITRQGRYGFLVDDATPEALARTILEAVSDPDRLARMGGEGQAHVLSNYSWDIVADKMMAVLEEEGGAQRTSQPVPVRTAAAPRAQRDPVPIH